MEELQKVITELFDKSHDKMNSRVCTEEDFLKAKQTKQDCEIVLQFIFLVNRDRAEQKRP